MSFVILRSTLQAVSREIRKILTERAANFSIALDDVSITSLTFGKEFTAAIEAKQVAAQEAERAKFVVEKAEQDKRSAVIRAQVKAFWACAVSCRSNLQLIIFKILSTTDLEFKMTFDDFMMNFVFVSFLTFLLCFGFG